jgi:hypothetical protein
MRFWLFPTYEHQQRTAIRPEAAPLLEAALLERPPEGIIRLTHWADVPKVFHVPTLEAALRLQDVHLWSEQTVRQRFAYRRPGLFVLPVRVHSAAQPQELPAVAEYAGCKSWVALKEELSTDGATPVLTDKDFRAVLQTLENILGSKT